MINLVIKKTKKIMLCTMIALTMIAQPCLVQAESIGTANTNLSDAENSIDEGIYNLNYNKYEILSNKGETITNFVPKKGMNKDGHFVLIENTKRTLSNSPIDISVVESTLDRTYPGSILLANEDFIKNKPTVITCDRQPIEICVDLPGLASENSLIVENPNYSSISSAIDEIVNKWANKNYSTHSLPTRTQYNEAMVYSKSQIAATLHLDDKQLTDLFNIDFNAVVSGEKQIMIASYKQIFYTASAALPSDPSRLFAPGVTFRDLQRKGVSDTAPPIMVNNVSYGRTIYVKFETTSTSNKVKTAFQALVKGLDANTSPEFEDIYNNSTFTAVVFGGDAQAHNKLISTDYKQIREVLINNSEFSLKNPGYPISFTTAFLKDNALAAIYNTTDYIETKTTEYPHGRLTLATHGAYVARFNVSWDELSFDEDGNEILTHREWEGNDKNRTASYSVVLPLSGNIRNLHVVARECTGLAWEWWRTLVDEENILLSGNTVVSIGGTTLNTSAHITYN